MYAILLALCVVAVAFVVQRFATRIDEQLNACGTGTFKDGGCECQHPYAGTHCEIVDCGYGKLVDSVFAYDTITTPKGPTGCECENQYWGYNCMNCTSKVSGSCTGPCNLTYYGPRCDVLCKEGTENDEPGFLHRESGGTYNYFVDHGFCLKDGTVKCREGYAGAHCQFECPDCVFGKCDLADGTCDCFDGYFGELCDGTCPGRCSGLNGVCQDDGTCDCYPGFTGADCSLECCVEGRGTELGSVHGNCSSQGGCSCFAEVIPLDLPSEMASSVAYDGVGWQGPDCDCHENVTCGGRGRCVNGRCDCTANFQGLRCDICADDKIGPFCQYDRWQCPNETVSHGEFVPSNSHGDYGCKCNSGFTGERCEDCIAQAYPKEGVDMCTFIVPDSLCHSGTVKSTYAGTGDMCDCSGYFDVNSDCALCEDGWFGPGCDIECGSKCTDSKGTCLLSGPGCVCPKGMQLIDGACATCGAGGCSNGECINGRCQCDPGFYGDLCDISAPKFNGKVCNGFPHVVDENIVNQLARCSIANDCTNTSHAVAANRAVAQKARKFDLDVFCHRDDTPLGLKGVTGCCVDRDATGFCEKDMLLETVCEYSNGGATLDGEIVSDICNRRNLESEVNVFEWCLSRERNCSENGDCADPDLCEDMCENQDTALWQAYWENDHASSMTKLLSEPWRFPIAFEDPYEYRVPYSDATISGVCKAGGHYKTCRDHLIPDTSVFNVTHKYTNKWEPMPSYSCGDVQFLSVHVEGTLNYTVSTVASGFSALLPNTAAFAIYQGQDVTSGPIDTLTLVGKGEVQVVLYNSTNATCTEFIHKAAEDWAMCKEVTFFEFDYDWSGFCGVSYDMVGEFNETCYQQSKVCEGCENYQEGCVGLPVNMSSPMPPPCDKGWDDFCPGYLANGTLEGVCAHARCECEGYGIGGSSCSLQCPVPQGVTSELGCGAGEDPPWGECRKGDGSVALGYEQGECYCFNEGDPAKGCTKVCDATQDCSTDVDTPFQFTGNCSAYRGAVGETICDVNLTDSMCNYYRGRCECATPFTVYTVENQTEYMNPYGSYRVALMQGYEIDEYLNFTTYTGTEPTDLVAAFDDLDPNIKCFKDLAHTQEVPCDWIRALKHFARGGSYRIGDCHNLAPGTKDQVPCSGHGFPVSGTCACDYAEEFQLRSSGVGLAFELPGLTETPWRGKDCSFLCPGYDMKSMDSVCSGHGLCESDGRCSCDQGYTGYKCDLSCEKTQEVLTCSGHGTCDERLYRRAGSSETVYAFDTNCVNESMYLARDRVVERGGIVYHMFEQLGLKVTEYPGATRDATVEDYFIEGTAVRHPYGHVSDVPFMPCKDTFLVKREEAILPSWAGVGTADVEISCNVLPNYEVRCGQCTCEETSQTGHWTGHDCRTPSLGYFGRDARLTCPGMVNGVPCNGGGTCMWGSKDGLGVDFKVNTECFCGDPGPDATLATAPRNSNNRFLVHAMNGDTPLYRKVVDSVDKGGVCPDGTVEDTDPTKCIPAPLELENYNDDCSCKFGFTGTKCETPRMMCLFDGEETDGTSCICTDENGEPNEKVNAKGCCTKGTYWDQKRYRSFSLITDFVVLEDNPLYTSSFLQVCSPVADDIPEAEAVFQQHNYIVTTDEYILEPTLLPCSGREVTLAAAIQRHKEDIGSGKQTVPAHADPVQWCTQTCDVGFVLEGSECSCRNSLAFVDGDQRVFTESLPGSGMRYDILHPSADCYKTQDGELIGPKKINNRRYLEPTRFLRLENISVKAASSVEECFGACTGAFTFGEQISGYVTDTETELSWNYPDGGRERVAPDSRYYRESLVDECAARCTAEKYELGFFVGLKEQFSDLCYCRGGRSRGTLVGYEGMFRVYKFVLSSQCKCGDPLPPFYVAAHQGECEKNGRKWEMRKTSGDASVDTCANVCSGEKLIYDYMSSYTITQKPSGTWDKRTIPPGGEHRVYTSSQFHRSNLAEECAARCVDAGFFEGFNIGKCCGYENLCYCKDNGDVDINIPSYTTVRAWDLYEITGSKLTREMPVLGFIYKPGTCNCEANPSHPDPDCSWSHPGDEYIRYDFTSEAAAWGSNGYIIREYEDNVYRYTDFTTPYKNTKPCSIDTYLSYPENMGTECDCPIDGFEPSGQNGDSVVYSVSLEDLNATIHTCIETCTRAGHTTARIEEETMFKCFCGKDPIDGTDAYKLTAGDATCECPGFYMQAGHAYSCKAGSYSDGACSSRCKMCPVGKWSEEGATSCDFCAAGKIQVSEKLCTDCPEGFFSSERDAQCTQCAEGKFSGVGSTACAHCAAGKYSPKGSSSCVDCAVGEYSNAGDGECSDCTGGKYSSAGAPSCTNCAAGRYSSSRAASCSSCSGGRFSEGGASSCKNCPAGFLSNTGFGFSRCAQCPEGYYQEQTERTSCNACPHSVANGQISDYSGRTGGFYYPNTDRSRKSACLFIKDCSTGPSSYEGIKANGASNDFTNVHCFADEGYLLGYDPNKYILRCCWSPVECNDVLSNRLFNYDLRSANQPTAGSWTRCDPEHVGYYRL